MIGSGYGGLSLSIEGPSKADIECQDNEDGSCRVTYRPTEPGNYVVNVKFADEHVPGMCGCVCLCACGSVTTITRIACIDPHQTGFIGKGSDRLQLIKF